MVQNDMSAIAWKRDSQECSTEHSILTFESYYNTTHIFFKIDVIIL